MRPVLLYQGGDLKKMADSKSAKNKKGEIFLTNSEYIPNIVNALKEFNDFCPWAAQGCKYLSSVGTYKALLFCRLCELKAYVYINEESGKININFFLNKISDDRNKSSRLVSIHKTGNGKCPVIRDEERLKLMNEAKKLSSARLLWAKENAEQSKTKILAGKQQITLHQAQRLKKDSKKLDYVDNDVEKSLEMLCRAPEGDPIIKKLDKGS